jgi:hypothetical protein
MHAAAQVDIVPREEGKPEGGPAALPAAPEQPAICPPAVSNPPTVPTNMYPGMYQYPGPAPGGLPPAPSGKLLGAPGMPGIDPAAAMVYQQQQQALMAAAAHQWAAQAAGLAQQQQPAQPAGANAAAAAAVAAMAAQQQQQQQQQQPVAAGGVVPGGGGGPGGPAAAVGARPSADGHLGQV